MKIKKIAKNALEQLAHFLWAAIPVGIMITVDVLVVAGGLAGLAICLPREIVTQWPINRPWDTVLDITFFVIGGAAAGYFISGHLS
jgi:hypothetical protein